jgi:glutaminase
MEFGRMQSAPRTETAIASPEPSNDDASRIQQIIDDLYRKYRGVDDGEVATYIPELGKADPNDFAICVATTQGRVFRAGDYDKEFTIQSMSKPFAFQIALEECGVEEVFKRVGVEPSGDAFNSIELDAKTSRPYNPMINAGAIAISSLIKKDPVEAGIQQFVDRLSGAAGRQLRIDYEVMRSEALTGNRNRAIAYLMRNFEVIDEYLHESLQQYFAQCSVLVNCRDMAMMAATVANMGRNPVTAKQVFDFRYLKYMLTVMFTCGLYDYAGGWAYEVGLPAKSGVAGGIFGVVNRQLGISVYSPRLDRQGNSVRGILVCKELATHLGLHAFEFTNSGSSFMQWLL